MLGFQEAILQKSIGLAEDFKRRIMKLLGIEMPLQEFDQLICEQNKGKELKVVDGRVVAIERIVTDKEKNEIRISELKSLLLSTDYQAIKYAEGAISIEEYLPIKKQRQLWRDEINNLENIQ